jgi:phage-related protein
MVPEKFFKYLEGTDGLFEVRIKVGSDTFRIFCFFDEGNLTILLNGFRKKTEKTPKIEIDRAERLKQKYYEEKSRQ